MLGIGIAVAVLALLSYTLGDSLAKYPSAKLGHYKVAVIVLGAGLLPILALFLFPNLIGAFTPYVIALSLVAGLPLATWYVFVYKTLETEQVGNTMALAEIPYLILMLYGVFGLNEQITPVEAVAIAAIALGVVLVTTKKGFAFNKKMVPAIIGMTILGLFYIPFVYAVTVSGGVGIPALITRAVAFLAVLTNYAFFSKHKKPSKAGRPMDWTSAVFVAAVLVGVLDAGGEIGVGGISLLGVVAIGGAIIAIEPLLVVLFGYKFYKERFTPLQMLGVAIAIIGAVVLSIA